MRPQGLSSFCYHPWRITLPLVRGPALAKPSLKTKLTSPGVVGPVSTATRVKATGMATLIPRLLTSITVPSPVMVIDRGRIVGSNWADWIWVDWKLFQIGRASCRERVEVAVVGVGGKSTGDKGTERGK